MAASDKNSDESGPFAGSADNDREAVVGGTEAGADDIYEAEELALDDDSERLPWLDADDDDVEEPDNGRILGLVLLGLIALATIVGGIWWSTNRTPDATLVADGSTIQAPPGDYKEAPKDPGGKTFDGTGNTAFAVSEGQSRPAKLGETTTPAAGPAPKPTIDLAKVPANNVASAPAGTATAAPTATPVSGPAVQVGAYSTRASAEAAWGRLSQQYSALSGTRHQVVEGKADIGTVFRLQALPGDASAAQGLCSRLKSAGLACQVK